jgi:hypothetical protein
MHFIFMKVAKLLMEVVSDPNTAIQADPTVPKSFWIWLIAIVALFLGYFG